MFAALGQDNKLYFTGDNNSRGIWRLDDDGEIRRTNKTTDYFMFAALGQDNKLYFVGSGVGTGIWRLDDDGEIRQTNITTGTFNFAALGQDGKLYFCAYGTGIWRLDDDGEIRQTNKTTGYFYFAALGQDGKLYFAGDGIYYLYVPDNTGNALAKTLILQVLEDGTVIESVPYSILDAFGTYPAIVEADYTDMTDSDVETRAQALIEHVAAEEDIDEYTVSNEVIEYDTDMCPIPET
jgi:hypothetical protein